MANGIQNMLKIVGCDSANTYLFCLQYLSCERVRACVCAQNACYSPNCCQHSNEYVCKHFCLYSCGNKSHTIKYLKYLTSKTYKHTHTHTHDYIHTQYPFSITCHTICDHYSFLLRSLSFNVSPVPFHAISPSLILSLTLSLSIFLSLIQLPCPLSIIRTQNG